MTSTKLKPQSDQVDSANTTVQEDQNSQMSKNSDISQKDTLLFFPFLECNRKSNPLGLLYPQDTGTPVFEMLVTRYQSTQC